MRLALLNRSTERCFITAIHLNRFGVAGHGLTWTPAEPVVSLMSGEIVMVPVAEFRAAATEGVRASPTCSMPMHLAIEATCGNTAKPDVFNFNFDVRLPNTLPDSWTRCTPVVTSPSPASAPSR